LAAESLVQYFLEMIKKIKMIINESKVDIAVADVESW
jgi:hypothetical protein